MKKKLTWQHYAHLIIVKARANLQAEAANNYLSYLWWAFEPMLHMVVYYAVFGFLLNRGTDNYAAFLLTGLIPWLWFNKSITSAMSSIISGKGLMRQVHIPKIILPTITICRDSVKQLVVMIVLLLFLVFSGINFSFCWLALPVLLLVQLLLIVASSYFIASIIPFIPDLRYLVTAGLQMLFFGSGIFYSVDTISAQYRDLFYLNPIANLLINYRNIFLHNQWPDWASLLYITCGSLLVIVIMWFVLRKLDHIYPRVVV